MCSVLTSCSKEEWLLAVLCCFKAREIYAASVAASWFFNSELGLNQSAFCYQGFGLSKNKQESSPKQYFPNFWFVRGMF